MRSSHKFLESIGVLFGFKCSKISNIYYLQILFIRVLISVTSSFRVGDRYDGIVNDVTILPNPSHSLTHFTKC
jgi:hypothetical protein